MPRRVVDPRVIALGVGVPLVILLVVVVLSIRDGTGGEGEPSGTTSTGATDLEPGIREPSIDERWNDDLAATVEPLTTVLVDLASTVDAWSNGDVGDGELAALLERVTPVVATVRRGARQMDAHPDDPIAQPLIIGMADLYAEAVDAHRFALDATGDTRRQYDHLGRRLRILGDRVFDRARERTMAAVDVGPDTKFVLPAEVPDWERLEIAAGPPLVTEDANRPDELPLTREEERATQTEDEWRRAVEALDAPTSDDVRRAAADDLEALDGVARELVAAAEALRVVPVPDGDRGRADRVALGWLVRADAARAAQLALLDDRTDDGTGALVDSLLSVSAAAALSDR